MTNYDVLNFQDLLNYAEFVTGVRGISNIGVCRNGDGKIYAFLGHENTATYFPKYEGVINNDYLIEDNPKLFRVKINGNHVLAWLRKKNSKIEVLKQEGEDFLKPTENDFYLYSDNSEELEEFHNLGVKR